MTKREQVQRGKRMRAMRERAGIRLEQMAANLEVSARTIENWESGATKASKADMLAYEHFVAEARCDQPSRPLSWNLVEQLDLFSSVPQAADVRGGGVLWEFSDRSSDDTSMSADDVANGLVRQLVA